MAFKQFSHKSIPSDPQHEFPLNNRQESHRIYLQVFAPRTSYPAAASMTTNVSSNPIPRHDSHTIHPPNYPIATPDEPYQFTSPSDYSASTFSSYTFSSASTTATSSIADTSHTGTNTTVKNDHIGSKVHNKPRYVGYPSTSTTSAAVRLTDRAKAKDVTALLRGKFGLPPISINVGGTDRDVSHMQQVHHAYDSKSISNVESEEEVDVLVLVGTLERPPKGYIRFEHEEILEEQCRLKTFRQFKNAQLTMNQNVVDNSGMQVSASADTIRASGGEKGLIFATSTNTCSSDQAIGYSSSSGDDLANISGTASPAIGLDLSSSRGGNILQPNPWVSMNQSVRSPLNQSPISELPVPLDVPEKFSSMYSSPSKTVNDKIQSRAKLLDYESDFEPIHMVRTVHPDEHPLQVRDEMMNALVRLQREAEDEMGLRLHFDVEKSDSLLEHQLSKPTFRWFFQPCSALGGSGMSSSSSKIQSVPAFIDIEGYCTGYDGSDSDSSDNNDDKEDNGESKDDYLPLAMKKLVQERRQITVLRDLTDVFVVSGYLLKQSHKDSNVWKRVYCILDEDRLWIVRRMKTISLTSKFESNLPGIEDALSPLRIGRHSYIKLHRSLLLESTDDASSSLLGRRLPNTFRLISFNGSYHTFRAYNASSLRVWTSSLSEKITLKHCDGLMDLANVIAEDEAMARCKRICNVAVTPLLDKFLLGNSLDSQLPVLSADVTRFGVSVAEYREMCRHAAKTVSQCRNISSSGGVDIVSVLWEDARGVASNSAQLLHAFAAQQQHTSDTGKAISALMETLLQQQKELQIMMGKRWNEIRTSSTREESKLELPSANIFDSILDTFQTVCLAMHN